MEDEFEKYDEGMEDLKAAAFEVLLLNPGSDMNDWIRELTASYVPEVVDALGTDQREVEMELEEMWDTAYLDPASCIEKTYREWANAFATYDAVDIYYALVDAKEPTEGCEG